MKIIHRYMLSTFLRNLGLSLLAFTLLFLIFDFFDRIDNILPEDAPVYIIVEYFVLKVPLIMSLMLPVSMLVSVVFTVGLLSKNSEITAMRASGMTVLWIAKPLFIVGLITSFLAIILNESIVPYTTRRTKEIYNIDIQKKNADGVYSQNDFWWRTDNSFFAVGMFDSRSDTLINLSRFDISDTFDVFRRVDAAKAEYLVPNLGWSMKDVTEYRFHGNQPPTVLHNPEAEPLPIASVPRDFYDMKTDPATMSFRRLKKFIREQAANGISTRSYLADLYEKFASPFLIFIVIPVVLPFALKPARSGSLAWSFLAALSVGFSYYAVHSLSLALGRAELWPPLLSAWMANIVMGIVGAVLSLGAEAPN
jgi:lipopolysaccharide export system permease protein